jgi:RNA polymerase sigma-70 factor, ECF subfamily
VRADAFADAAGLGRAPPTLEAELGEAIAAARLAYPSVAMDERAFLQHLARHVGERAKQPGWMQSVRVGDLFLAQAALAGDPQALELVDAKVLRPAAASARRISPGGDFVAEVHQRLRERLLLAERGQPARLSDYAGAGPLLSWAKVAATRVALNLKPPPKRDVPLELEVVADTRSDPELSVIGRKNAAKLSEAFRDAARTLTDEERVLLRYHFVDGLNFEQIAPLFQTHRSTISRRISATRKRLLELTQKTLRERFQISVSEASSLIREAKSRMDGSITAWLRSSN